MEQKLKLIPTKFKDLIVIESLPYKDLRGEFSRIFCTNELSDFFNGEIKQINHSLTYEKGSVRGLHFQYMPNSDIKIVKVIKGKILDIVVDIRTDSPTFLETFSIELSNSNQKMILIPKGFAHGFQTLEDNCELLYIHSDVYVPNNEGALNINDPKLNITCPLPIKNLSKRDQEHQFIDHNFKGIKIDEM